MAYLSVEAGGGNPKSGQAMETYVPSTFDRPGLKISTAVAAVISLLSLFTASLGLHLRLKQASAHWKKEATMVKRRSMMSMNDKPMAVVEGKPMANPSETTLAGPNGKRWSTAPEYTLGNGSLKHSDEEERLESETELARRNSKDQEAMIRRAS